MLSFISQVNLRALKDSLVKKNIVIKKALSLTHLKYLRMTE